VDPDRKRALYEALGVSALVTCAVTVASGTLPDRYVAAAVGLVFLGAAWAMVWRKDDARVLAAGLTFGGVVLPGAFDAKAALASAARAVAWAAALALVTFAPFFLGWRWWWHATGRFHLDPLRWDALNDAFGQLVIIALPEEAFYRGYLQSRLDDVWTPRWRVLGAALGPGVVAGAVLFAVGHFATIREPARFAVFFPALVFGWLRARTGGVGASMAFHALCNIFSEALGRGYGVY
jgi:membrane protease YdiL (CAAX protease family)